MNRGVLMACLYDEGWQVIREDAAGTKLERNGWACTVTTTGLVELMTIPLFTVRATWAVPDDVVLRRIKAVTS